jgi:hypothetical protein
MAADDIAKGASHLIRWGKKIIPATDVEIKGYGPNAARVNALLNMIWKVSTDGGRLGNKVGDTPSINNALKDLDNVLQKEFLTNNTRIQNAVTAQQDAYSLGARVGNVLRREGTKAAAAEVASDLITPEAYRTLTNPMAIAKRFDMTMPNAPEGFTNVARTLSERGLVTGPKDIELARRISMLPPHLQDVYFNLLQDGSDPMAIVAALKLLG